METWKIRMKSLFTVAIVIFTANILATCEASWRGRGSNPLWRPSHGQPPLAFLGGKKKTNPLIFPYSNQSASLLTTGNSNLHLYNCTVSLISLDPTALVNNGNRGGGRNVTLQGARSSPTTAASVTLRQQQKNPLDSLVGEVFSTISGALLDAFCFWAATRIIIGVKNLFARKHTKSTGVKFSDVIGCNYAKEEVMDLVKYLQDPSRYKTLGAKIPRGILLVGPPGVGKTLLAKALAGEASVPFYYASGADFAQPYWGMGVQLIKKLFRQARKSKKSIIFIDEFDALARARRSNSNGGSAEMDSENSLNQLLTEMDGFSTQENVIVLASTNRPDILDKAALRPGRFDRKVFIDAPDVEGRQELFYRLLSQMKLEKDANLLAPLLAKLTPGFVGADIVNSVNEAALRAAKLNRSCILEEDLSWATERTGFGVERQSRISPVELRRTAVHEAGHALISYMLPSAEVPVKVSIISRGTTGGYNLMNEANRTYHTESRLRDEICVLLGGRVAEELVLGEPSSGAVDDLKKASHLARTMIEKLGYGKRTGLLCTEGYGGGVGSYPQEISQATLRVLEEEAQSILASEYSRAKILVGKHRHRLSKLVNLLLEKEVIHENDIRDAFGPRIAV